MTAGAGTGYLPAPARIASVEDESEDTRTFELVTEPGVGLASYHPGQFLMLSLLGVGEAAFSLSSLPRREALRSVLTITVRRVGVLTTALFARGEGDLVGVRGPFGHGFPDVRHEATLHVAGGCGLSPLKAAIELQLATRSGPTPVGVLYGARSAESRIHRSALDRWRTQPATSVLECVELATAAWTGRTGQVPDLLAEALAATAARSAFVCGPPALLWRAGTELERLGVDPARIHLAIERQMKCGTGQCGHCYVNERYACVDGPVFPWAELREMPDAFRRTAAS